MWKACRPSWINIKRGGQQSSYHEGWSPAENKAEQVCSFSVWLSSYYLYLPRARKLAVLLKQVLCDDFQGSTSAMMELKHDLDILSTLENGNLAY